jgi:dipeptidyl aminopeptidase/acylaminoacyl peptidase
VQLGSHSIDVVLFGKPDAASIPLPEGLTASGGVISPSGEEIAFQQVIPSGANSVARTHEPNYKRILSVSKTDGTNLRQFQQITEPTSFCWSADGKLLAFVSAMVSDTGVVTAHPLQLLDLRSGKIASIDTSANISSQCWHPDGSAFVFEKGGTLWVFNIGEEKATPLTRGDHGTWSPDGRSIAFRRGESFFTIKRSGTDEKPIFERKNVLTELWWSTDSQYVACVVQPSMWKTSWHIMDELDVLVLRLHDRKEIVAFRFSGKGRSIDFQWVKSLALFNRARTARQP